MNIYEEYKKTQTEIDKLERDKELLREQISKELPPEGLENEFVRAKWKPKKKWTYSDAVNKLEKDYKNAKVIEEHNGTAKFEEEKILTINVIK